MKEFVIVAVLLCLSNFASAKKGNKFMVSRFNHGCQEEEGKAGSKFQVSQ